MTLIKRAEGLPKFTMAVGFWRSRKRVGMSLAAIGLETAGVAYCYEHSIDGQLPKGHENVAAAFGLKVSQVRGAMKELLEREIWKEHPDHIEIVNFLEHNPSTKEVKEHRQKREAAAIKANHARWHKDKVDPECPLCVEQSGSDSDGLSDSDANGTPRTDSQRRGEKSRGRDVEDSPQRQLQDFHLTEPFERARTAARKDQAFGKCPHGKPDVSLCDHPDCQGRAEIVMRRYLDEVPA